MHYFTENRVPNAITGMDERENRQPDMDVSMKPIAAHRARRIVSATIPIPYRHADILNVIGRMRHQVTGFHSRRNSSGRLADAPEVCSGGLLDPRDVPMRERRQPYRNNP